MAISNIDRQVSQRLAANDVRYTPGRSRVVETLAQEAGPRSATELSLIIGDTVPLSSLYRTLSILEGTGVVTPHFTKEGIARYELAEWLKGHHHHLVCIDCGGIEDIQLMPKIEKTVHDLVAEIGADSGFETTAHTLEIEGRCASCR